MPKRPQGRKAPRDAVGNPVKPGSVVRDRKEPEELEAERIKRAAAELGAGEGKRAPPVCPRNDERRSPEQQQQKGGTNRREQSDQVDASGFYGARIRITGTPTSKVVRMPARARPQGEHLHKRGCSPER